MDPSESEADIPDADADDAAEGTDHHICYEESWQEIVSERLHKAERAYDYVHYPLEEAVENEPAHRADTLLTVVDEALEVLENAPRDDAWLTYYCTFMSLKVAGELMRAGVYHGSALTPTRSMGDRLEDLMEALQRIERAQDACDEYEPSPVVHLLDAFPGVSSISQETCRRAWQAVLASRERLMKAEPYQVALALARKAALDVNDRDKNPWHILACIEQAQSLLWTIPQDPQGKVLMGALEKLCDGVSDTFLRDSAKALANARGKIEAAEVVQKGGGDAQVVLGLVEAALGYLEKVRYPDHLAEAEALMERAGALRGTP